MTTEQALAIAEEEAEAIFKADGTVLSSNEVEAMAQALAIANARYVYVVRCQNGNYSVVALPEMIDEARTRAPEYTSSAAALSGAGVPDSVFDLLETTRVDGHNRHACAYLRG